MTKKQPSFLSEHPSLDFAFGLQWCFCLTATGINTQIANSIGEDFFAVTTLIICLIIGAFIGDLMGKNKEHSTDIHSQNQK